MDFWWLLILAVSLAMDCFAVSLGIGSSPLPTTPRRVFRIAYHFGFFQFAMCCLGWLLGSTVVNFISGFDHWIAFTLLAWVGVRMIREGLTGEEEEVEREDPSRGKTLIMLSLATSMDSLGVGLSLALLKINILVASLLIGLVSLIFSAIGMLVGNKLNEKFGERMEIAGGVVLLLIGLRILITHLAG
jgi:manganese efflux pump family protein